MPGVSAIRKLWDNPFVARLQLTIQHFQRDDGNLLAAAVAYYTALSFFPLLLVLIAGLAVFFQTTQSGQNAEAQLVAAISQQLSPSLGEQVKEALSKVQDKANVGGPLGIAGLLFAAVTIFAQFERAFDKIWNVEDPEDMGVVATIRKVLFERLVAFALLVSMGLLIVAVFVANMVLATAQSYTSSLMSLPAWVWNSSQIVASVLLNALVVGILYKTLPKATVRWSEALRGGLFTAIVWEIGRQILAATIIGEKYSAYGVVGSFIGILLWMYYSVAVLFMGAEYVQALCAESKQATTDKGQGI